MRLIFSILAFFLLALTALAGQFNIYYDPADEDFVGRIRPFIKDDFERIAADVGYYSTKEIEIYISRTSEEFSRLYGKEPPQEIIGFARIDPHPLIVLKSPLLAPQANFRDTLKHEMSHIILLDLFAGREVPRWINEGFAMYESGELRVNHYAVVASAAVRGELLPLDQLDYAFYSKGSKLDLAYAQSYYLMNYIIGEYGPDKFKAFVLNFIGSHDLEQAVEETFGIDYDSFEKNWRASIKERYWLASFLAYSSPVWIMIIIGLAVYFVRKRRNQKIVEKWEEEELENPFFHGKIDGQ